jgi:hypothetical protein
MPTGKTLKLCLRFPVITMDKCAVGALLAGVLRGLFWFYPASIFGFVGQHSEELRPTAI